MRVITRAIYFSAALFTSTLCDEHIHANFHERRALSDILRELQTAEPEGNNLALNSQLEAIKTAKKLPTGDGVANYILGGNEAAKTASLPSNQGAVWVTISNGKFVGGGNGGAATPTPAAERATSSSAAARESPMQASPSAKEPSATTPPAEAAPARPANPMSTTTMTETRTRTMWSTVIMGSPSGGALLPSGTLPPAALVPGVLPPSPVREGMTQGTGRIENGACNCACNCPANSFPMGQRPIMPGVPLPSTTLATVILPPTAPVALPPGGLIVDTGLPPGGALKTAPIVIPNPGLPSAAPPIATAPAAANPPPVIPQPVAAPVSSIPAAIPPPVAAPVSSIPAVFPPPVVSAPATVIPVTTSTTSTTAPTIPSAPPVAAPVSTQPLPIVAPPPVASIPPAAQPAAAESAIPESSIQLGLTTAPPSLPTAIAELAAPGEPAINIETFSLASTLVLGALGR